MAKKELKQSKDKTHFFKDFKAELKKVSWPTPKQLVNNTAVVIVIVIIAAVIVFALDFAFNFIHESGVTKLQTVVQEKFSNDQEQTSQEDEVIEENTSNETTDEVNETETDEN